MVEEIKTARKSFIPEAHCWVIVANNKYNELRNIEGFEDFQDLEHVKNDVKKVKDGFK